MTKQNRNDDAEIIDVAYQTATDNELFGQMPQRQQTMRSVQEDSEDALVELAREVMLDPERCFCRNCGQPIYKNASVCVHCRYVVNPTALQQGQRLVRARREKYESSKVTKIQRFVRKFTGIDLEPQEQKNRWAVRTQDYRYQTTGQVHCSNCGCIVDREAAVCVNCNYVLDPIAIRKAEIALRDKTAKVTRKELLMSALIPGHGFRLSKQYSARRPQVAKPCLLAGIGNISAIVLMILLFLSFLF